VLPAKRYTVADIVSIAVRRRWLILLPFALGVAAMPVIAPRVPERYRSETLILVVPQRVPDAYVKATVTETVEDRLPSISDQILSRSRLERIITDLDLYQADRARDVMEDVVSRMRNDIKVTLTPKSLDSFRVSYVNTNPAIARQVTERLASLYIDQNSKDRETQAESTNQFLEAQLHDAKVRLVEHEKKLESYRRTHSGQLPSQLQGNLQAVQNAQLQLQAASETMNRALERRLLIERQIADTEALPIAAAPAAAGDTTEPANPALQLEAARARLAASKVRYTPEHPDVLTLQRIISDLEKRVAEEDPAAPIETNPRALSPLEAAQQKKVLDLKAELDVVDLQLKANQVEEARLKQVINEYQAKIDALPKRESELTELTRDYSTLQTAYSTLLLKREDSKIAANLERQQIGEQFRVLDPASLPQRPFNQLQRIAVIGSAAGGGLVLGVLAIAALEFLNSTFRREDEVLRLLKLPVLALIPVMTSAQQHRRARRQALLIDGAGLAILLLTTAVLAVWRLGA
jgi:polysaccharide chain length determinant protein (PEP-CTERM system associated)